MSKIFIDPGHGGHDGGASGAKSKEKDNVLKVALKLKTLLEKSGHTVKLSRTTDVYLTLNERARLANAWGAEYFVSLHNNSASNNTATGFETFVHDGSLQTKTVAFQNALHNEITKNIGIRDRGKKRANFAVLRLTRMPAVLIEYAFINNPNDEAVLINQVENLALWTAQGINATAGGVLPKSKDGWQKSNNKWSYIKDGKRATGWQSINGKWYYLNNEGIMQTGWVKLKDKWYYLNPNGDMATGWKKVKDKWYLLDDSGAMLTGWQKVKGKWYILADNGAMYEFDQSGALKE